MLRNMLFHGTRRSFLAASAAIGTSAAAVQDRTSSAATAIQTLTAATVIERIKAHVGIPWFPKTVDRLIIGNPDTAIAGIAVTMMATLDVCKRAHADGKNLVITHESTFFSHQDTLDGLQSDRTYSCKRDFLESNNMAVFHFHDHWHARHPDGIAAGMIRELGWEQYTDAADAANGLKHLTFPATPLRQLATTMATRLGARTMRVVGDPNLAIRRAVTSWGYIGAGIPLISQDGVDVLICGETREWELVEYVQDMISCGENKALIMVGHVLSEGAGMKLCADWLRTFIPEVPIGFMYAPEPFWPVSPVSV